MLLLCSIAVALSVYYHYNSRSGERDAQMVQTAKILDVLLIDQDMDDIEIIQERLDALYNDDEEIVSPEYPNQTPLNNLMRNFQFQVKKIIDNHESIILRSPKAPTLPSTLEGFNVIDGYHFYTSVGANHIIIVSQEDNIAQYFSSKNSKIAIVIMIITMLISITVISYIINHNLKSLSRMSHSIRNKNVNHLSAINLNEVPVEIQPIVDALNQIFTRINEVILREKRFAQDAAHELKTPLASLKALSQIAINYSPKKEVKEQLNKIIQVVNEQTHIVNQLLTLSKTLTNTTITSNPIYVRPIISELIAQLIPTALQKNIDIELEAKEVPYQLCIDPSSLRVIMRNLLDNAIRYSSSHQNITVRIHQIDHLCFIDVMDQGPGIPDDQQARVFERFHRILGNNQPGSGLGLNIVKEIVSHYDGTIELRNNKPNGLIVTLSFKLFSPQT